MGRSKSKHSQSNSETGQQKRKRDQGDLGDQYESPLTTPSSMDHDTSTELENSNGYHSAAAREMHEEPVDLERPAGQSSSMKRKSSSFESRIDIGETAEKEIEQDKREAQYVIANYGIDPVELLHMVERWTQILLGEFKAQKSSLRRSLKEKWEKNELQINSEHNDRSRQLFEHVRKLEKVLEEDLGKKSFDSLRDYVSKVDQNTDAKELKGRVTSLIEQYTNVLDSLEFIEKHHETMPCSSFGPLKTILERIRAQNNKPCYSICIIGLEKCGKSTFANALLGFELLPSASERCTQIRTVLKPTLPDDPTLFATVEFYDDSTFEKLMNKMTPKSEEQERDFESRKNYIRKKQKDLIDRHPNRWELFKLSGTPRNPVQQRQEMIPKLHHYITDELYVNIVREIVIYTDNLPGRNYEISDVPGFDSPIEEHRKTGLQAIQSADAFLFLTSGDRPSLTRDQIRLLDEIQDGKQHYEAMKRAFGVITKLDYCHTYHEYRDHYTKAVEELKSKGFRQDHIFAACPSINLLKQDSDAYRSVMPKIQHFNDLQKGFKNCKESLNQFIESELPKTHLNQLIDFGLKKLCRYVNECLTYVKKDPALSDSLKNHASYEQYLKERNSLKWDQIFEDELFEPVFSEANVWQKQIVQKERTNFIQDIKKLFQDRFMESTKKFIDHRVNLNDVMMKRFGYTALHSSSQVVDDQTREQLSFELEELVLQTANTLTRYLYDEYVCQLETILNKISPEGSDYLYHSEKVSYDTCLHEIRGILLRVCRPIITATLRFSHSNQASRRSAVDELILVAPTLISRLCDSSKNTKGTLADCIQNWTPILKQGIEIALDIFGKPGTQNQLAETILQFALKRAV